MAFSSIDHVINKCLQKLEDPDQMEKSLHKLSSMGLTEEILKRTGAGKVLTGYFSHPTLGSLAQSIVNGSCNTSPSTSSSNEKSASPDLLVAGDRKRRNSDEPEVPRWKRPKLAPVNGTMDENMFSRQRGFTRPFGGKVKKEEPVRLVIHDCSPAFLEAWASFCYDGGRGDKRATQADFDRIKAIYDKVEKNKENAKEEKTEEKKIKTPEQNLKAITEKIAKKAADKENGLRKTVSLGSVTGTRKARTFAPLTTVNIKTNPSITKVVSNIPHAKNNANVTRKPQGSLMIKALKMSGRK